MIVCTSSVDIILAGYLPFDENTMTTLFSKIKATDYNFPDWFSSESMSTICRYLLDCQFNLILTLSSISIYFHLTSFIINKIAKDLIASILVPDPHKRPSFVRHQTTSMDAIC